MDGKARLLNCTEGGAYIEGFEHIPLEEAVELCEAKAYDPIALLDEAVESLDREDRGELLIRHIDGLLSATERAASRAQQCKDVALIRPPTPQSLEKLEKLELGLQAAMRPATVLISLFGQDRIVSATQDTARDATLIGTLDAAIDLYDVVIRAYEMSKDRLANSRNRIEAQQ